MFFLWYNIFMTYTEILKETQFLLGFENDTGFVNYSKEAMTRHSNRALDELTSLILKVDGSWQWDDKNHTDLPISVTDIKQGQSQYTLSVKHLLISRLEVTNEEGIAHVLVPIDEADIDIAISELQKQTGTPKYYDKAGESLFLYPKADYDLIKGMRIYFSRPANYFTSSDDDKEPGFAEIFHEYIPLWNARHYASSQADMNATYQKMDNLLQDIKKRIIAHYNLRKRNGRITPYVPNSL